MLDDFRVCRVPGSPAAMVSVTPARRQLRGPRQTQTGPEPALEQAGKCPALFAGCNFDTATLTGGRMPPSLARWKRAATVAAAILAASECGFQPHTVCQRGGRVKLRPGISDLGSGGNLLAGRAVLCAPVFPMAILKRSGQRSARPALIRVYPRPPARDLSESVVENFSRPTTPSLSQR